MKNEQYFCKKFVFLSCIFSGILVSSLAMSGSEISNENIRPNKPIERESLQLTDIKQTDTIKPESKISGDLTSVSITKQGLLTGGGTGKGGWVWDEETATYTLNVKQNSKMSTLTHVRTTEAIKVIHDLADNTWSGTSTILKCERLGGSINGCKYIHINKPTPITITSVDTSNPNTDTIKTKVVTPTPLGDATTTVTYTMNKGQSLRNNANALEQQGAFTSTGRTDNKLAQGTGKGSGAWKYNTDAHTYTLNATYDSTFRAGGQVLTRFTTTELITLTSASTSDNVWVGTYEITGCKKTEGFNACGLIPLKKTINLLEATVNGNEGNRVITTVVDLDMGPAVGIAKRSVTYNATESN